MAINSWMELDNRVGWIHRDPRLETLFSCSSAWRYSGEKELDATKRVYNHPRFKQNLILDNDENWLQVRRQEVLNSLNDLLNSRRASAGHQNRETKAANKIPAVTATARCTPILTTATSFCLKL